MISSDEGLLMLRKWQDEKTSLSITFSGKGLIIHVFGRIKELTESTVVFDVVGNKGEVLVTSLQSVEFSYDDTRALPQDFRRGLDSFLGLRLATEETVSIVALEQTSAPQSD